MWTGEEIAEANSREPGQSRSKLDYILNIGGGNLDIIAETASELQSRRSNHVAAFFQLPYAVAIETGWYKLLGTENLQFEMRFEVCRLKFTASGQFRLERRPEGQGGRDDPLVTQAVALFPVWGHRARFHDKYLEHADQRHNKNPELVPQRFSWIDNRPISLRGYETNFAGRLIREINAALRHFLPAYSIVSFREAHAYDRLFSYFTMLAPGLLAFAGQFEPIQVPMFNNVLNGVTPDLVTQSIMQSALSVKHREISRFEAQILALERMRLQGEPALALVGTLSLLEWLLDSFLQRQGETVRNLHKAMRHPLVNFLAPPEFELLDRAREARNKAVHEAPPIRHSLKLPNDHSGQQADGMQLSITSNEVKKVVRLVFEIYKRINQIEVSLMRKILAQANEA